jgi:hypothetical protein
VRAPAAPPTPLATAAPPTHSVLPTAPPTQPAHPRVCSHVSCALVGVAFGVKRVEVRHSTQEAHGDAHLCALSKTTGFANSLIKRCTCLCWSGGVHLAV